MSWIAVAVGRRLPLIGCLAGLLHPFLHGTPLDPVCEGLLPLATLPKENGDV